MSALSPTTLRCPCTRAGLPLGESQCALCTFDEVNGVPTVPAPPPTDAELCAIYLRALDARAAATATERLALAQLTEGAMQMVARAMVARDAAHAAQEGT